MTEPTHPALELSDVHKSFDSVVAVKSVSFRVEPGRIFGLLGRNGAGKTTTLRMIAGVLYPDGGVIRIFGRPWTPATRDRLAYLPEERGLYKKMRVGDMLEYFAEIKGVTGARTRLAVDSILATLELSNHRATRIEELSKGNQQKVQLAGVMVADPDILLLDEPMSGLDPVNVILIREILLSLRERGKTIILSTHMMAEAEKLCDQVCLIHKGRVVVAGTVPEVRGSRNQSAIHVEFEGDGFQYSGLPGVLGGVVTGHAAELRIGSGTDTNQLLERILTMVRVRRFEVATPSLEDVFVERVGREAGADSEVQG